MKILTWNINGIRSSKVPLPQLFKALDADVLCFQETKITRDMLDEPTAIVEGFNSYFSFCRTKSGYSGVATYVKNDATPTKAEEGITGVHSEKLSQHDVIGCYGDNSLYADDEIHSLDNEGRCVMTQHQMLTEDGEEKTLVVINVYCPMAKLDDPDSVERMAFKLKFYDLLQKRAEAILASGSHVIVLGDVNASHRLIDHCDPCDEKEFNQHPSRQWLSTLLQSSTNSDGLFVDSFRHFYPEQRDAFTCWRTETGARATNYGTRIDYIIGDSSLVKRSFQDCVLKPDIEGSDHCPVKATLHWTCVPAKKCPPLCSKFLPEFVGKQQKLSSYFSKGSALKSSSQESNESAKRSCDVDVIKSNKKLKTKQGGIQNFFKQKPTEPKTDVATVEKISDIQSCRRQKFTDLKTDVATVEKISDIQSFRRQKLTDLKTDVATVEKINYVDKNAQSHCVNSWKSIFKIPPSAPLCSGHSELCVLRTVKKDSMNKGRQFWVCNRPEGHKSNKEARCEHFEWVAKKS